MKTVFTAFFALTLTLLGPAAPVNADPPSGRLTGGQIYTLPDWFKHSFLDLREDVDEAKAENRHLILFLHLDECPYCARTLDENFRRGDNKAFLESNFDVIAINIRGDKAVDWFDGKNYTEKELAGELRVIATPTLLFFDHGGKTVLRLNGYRKPRALRQALEYVHQKQYHKHTLASYVEREKHSVAYRFQSHPRFTDMTDFKGFNKPLAVIFEDKDCADCAEFHAKVFTHPEVQPELDKFTVVRLDAYSTAPIVDIDGDKTSAKGWARSLNVVYRPGVVFFNEGKERARMDGMQYRFHFKELLRYVSGHYYHEYGHFNAYHAARIRELLEQGAVIDYSQ